MGRGCSASFRRQQRSASNDVGKVAGRRDMADPRQLDPEKLEGQGKDFRVYWRAGQS
jgi:hypothetical protein